MATVLEARPRSRISAEGGGTGRRAFRAPLWLHAALLAVVLLVLLPVVGADGVFSADEGAALAQADLLAHEGRWTMEHPLPAVDPDGSSFPLGRSTRAEDGTWAPFAKHPLYAIVLAPVYRVAGPAGAMAVSIAGVVAAAVLAALVARRLAPALGTGGAAAALWLTGVASPLVVDGYIVIAHTLGAVCVAGAVALALRARRRARPRLATLAGVAAMVGVGALLRNEVVLFGFAVAAVAGVAGVRRRRIGDLAIGAAAFLGVAVAYVGEPRLVAALLGGESSDGFIVASRASGFVSDRIHGALITLVLPDYRTFGWSTALVVLSVVMAVAAAVVVRRRPDDHDGIILLAAVAAGLAVVRAAVDPAVVPGLLVAFPLLTVGLVLLRRPALEGDRGFVAAVCGVFALAVLATQYRTGGSGEWGWRYVAVAVPAAVALLVPVLADAGRRLSPGTGRAVMVLAAIGSVAFGVMGVRSVRSAHQVSEGAVLSVVTAAEGVDAGDGGAPVVVSTSEPLARFAWRHVDEQRWLLATRGGLAAIVDGLVAHGVAAFTLVSDDPAGDVVAAGWAAHEVPMCAERFTYTVVLVDVESGRLSCP